MADAGGTVWDAKFTYWYHPGTPLFPAYPSGSAGYAGFVEGVRPAGGRTVAGLLA